MSGNKSVGKDYGMTIFVDTPVNTPFGVMLR